jgi:hypothetical protein
MHENAGQLQQSLKQRHLTMIALGGVIGAGLFVGSASVIKSVGPAACLSRRRLRSRGGGGDFAEMATGHAAMVALPRIAAGDDG